jgi:hypothetical protein
VGVSCAAELKPVGGVGRFIPQVGGNGPRKEIELGRRLTSEKKGPEGP